MVSGISLLRQQATFFDRVSEENLSLIRPKRRERRVYTGWRDGQP
jgi:hypothetical protein